MLPHPCKILLTTPGKSTIDTSMEKISSDAQVHAACVSNLTIGKIN